MRYIVVTLRHHDGFSVFATRQNKHNVVDATAYGNDVTASLPANLDKNVETRCLIYSRFTLLQTSPRSGMMLGADNSPLF